MRIPATIAIETVKTVITDMVRDRRRLSSQFTTGSSRYASIAAMAMGIKTG
jgi:hypothetical protein